MNMKELINLKSQRKQAVEAYEKAFYDKQAALKSGDESTIAAATKDFDAKKLAVESICKTIDEAEGILAAKGAFEDGDTGMVSLYEKQQNDAAHKRARTELDAIRGTKEYTKAFQTALMEGVAPAKAAGRQEFAPLLKALTITGGDPTGSDGGYLVPLDFDGMIQQETKEFLDLSQLVNRETVGTNSGWRAVEKAGQRKKLPCIDEMGTIGKDNQPSFEKVTFTLKQYADRLPISNQLLQDVPGLLAYIAQWFGPKYILTKNDLILQLLNKQAFAAMEGATDAEKVKALKTLLNTGLNTAHSKAASILVNQNVYDEMDNWVDGNGRAMLVPDLSGDFNKFKNRPVYCGDNDLIGTIENGGTTYDPMYVGNFKRFATLFDRGIFEMAATNVGGDAWATNSTEIRVICRLDAQAMDTTAVKVTGFAADGADG